MRTLNRKKCRWLVKEWDRGVLSMTYICKTIGITPRYGWKLYRKYEQTGTLPYPKKPGRRSKPISEEDKQRILAMKERHPLSGADTLEKLLDQVGPHVPHNRIHVVLKAAGCAKDEPKKQKQRRYVRYERKHSNSLWHTDLFEKYQGDNLVILYEDDASRLITGGYLIDRPTAANCVIAGESAVSLFGRPVQLMSDHGTTFTSLPMEGCEEPSPNEFQQWLALSEIAHVKSTVNILNPMERSRKSEAS